jgi:CBS domain containing-hemolysin-like protein
MDTGSSSGILFGILSLFVLIAFNAFFVFAEYSLAVSRRTRITELAEQGNKTARVVLKVMEDPDRFFAATQVGITLMSVAIGVFSEPAFSALLEGLFGWLSISLSISAPWFKTIATILGGLVGLLIASYFQIVLAELVPRSITLRHAERVALIVVPPMNVVAAIFRPFVWLLKNSSRFVLRWLGFGAGSDTERLHSLEELRMLVEASEKGGAIEEEQGSLLSAVFSFGDTTVREVMIPRTEMTYVSVDATPHEVAHVFSLHPHTRLPVYEDSPDRIVGIIHSVDVMRALLTSTRSLSIRQLMHEPFYVPDTQRADELLQQFRARREHIAVVLDEYGGTAGIVTLNDLIARIIGQTDASLQTTPNIRQLMDGTAVINGLTSIGDVNEAFDLDLSDPNYDTIGGYIMGQLGRIPRAGDQIEVKDHNVQLRVEEMDKLRIAKVSLKRVQQSDS